MHAATGYGFDDGEQPLPVGEHVEHGGHLPDVLGIGAEEHQVAGDAEQLGQHDADDLRPGWNLDSCQALHCHDVRQVVHHAA